MERITDEIKEILPGVDREHYQHYYQSTHIALVEAILKLAEAIDKLNEK